MPALDQHTEPQAVGRDLLRQAGTLGLLTERELREGSVRIRAVPGHAVRALTVGAHRIAYVRLAPDRPGPDRRLAGERRVLDAVADSDIAPRVVGAEAEDALWLSAVHGSSLSDQDGSPIQLARVCQAWGSTLAVLHRAGSGVRAGRGAGPVLTRRPWVLEPDRLPAELHRVPPSSAADQVRRALTEESLLRRTAADVADRWSDRCWIHGDLDVDSVLVSQLPELQVRLVGFGHAGRGDPAWDLAAALESLVGLAEDGAPGWSPHQAATLGEELVGRYRRAGGPGLVDSGFRALRAVWIAWQVATSGPPASALGTNAPGTNARVAFWLGRARELAERAGRVGRAGLAA